METDKKKTGTWLYLFFIGVITVFTTINLYEFLTRKEPDGRLLGLNSMITVEDSAITLWGGIQHLMGKELAFGSTTYEDVTMLRNGYATMADLDPNYEAAITGITGAKELADEIGADFLYVAVPSKQRYASDYPEGITCYAVEKYDAVVSYARNNDIPVLDMKSVLESTGEEWFDYFYYSDHHWRNNAAFMAYQEICLYMQSCGVEITEEYTTKEAYSVTLYEDVFLGTHGRMAGPLYAGLDDYDLWLPNFETEFTLSVPSEGIYKEGTFEECFVNYENLASYSYDYYAYYAYLKEDFELFEITNEANANGPHVVIVRDSSAVPVSVFLATQCSELDIIDLRYTSDNHAIEYVTEKNPDFIIYLFGAGYLGNEGAMIMR